MINTDECLLWAGYINRDYGYISIKRNGKWSSTPIHRALYEAEYGQIPPKMVVDHLCRVKRCINLKHLEVVTNQVNIKRGVFKGNKKTHCKHGHEFTVENTIVFKRGTRHCRECHRRWHREWYARKK